MTEIHEKQGKLAREVLDLSRTTLLTKLRFLDAALNQLTWLPSEEETLSTDGEHLLYNPRHVLSCYKNAREAPVRDYLHLVLHCVFRHMFVSPAVNRPYWDLACDIAVENIITELRLRAVSAPREHQQAQQTAAIQSEVECLTAEKIYSYLQQTQPNPDQLAELASLFSADNHKIWYACPKEDRSQSIGEAKDNQRRNQTNSHKAAIASVWQKISHRMQMELEAFGEERGIGQGFSFGAMTQNLVAVNRERYDYTVFLRKFAVMGETQRINDGEFDYVFYTYGLNLYGNMPLIEPLEYKEIKAIREFVIAIDTSGSCSGEVVQAFVQKTYNILKSTESFFTKINLHIIQCDATVQEDVKITCQEDFDEYLKTMRIRGLGGTDFRPVFSHVDELRRKGEFGNLKGLIYFTDGYGAFPAKKPSYNTAFVFLENGCNNLDVPPWAIKLILEKDAVLEGPEARDCRPF